MSLVIYYTSWAFGAPSDASDQVEAYYTGAPRIPKWTYSLVVVLFLLFTLLFYVNTFELFSVFLLLFWVTHAAIYFYYLKAIVNPPLEASRQYFEDNFYYTKLEKLKVVENHNKGPWVVWRMTTGVVLGMVIVILAFTNLSQAVAGLNESLTPDFVKSLAIFLFVVSLEGWVWGMRIRMKVSFRNFNLIEDSYELCKRTD
ncbi:MAG: hypothetical protein ACYC6B_09905 [Thermoleophilia bacterium]